MSSKPDTKRVAQVRKMIKEDLKYSAIADALGITEKSVKGIVARYMLRPRVAKACGMPDCNETFSTRGMSRFCTTCSLSLNGRIREHHARGHNAASMVRLIGTDRPTIVSRMKTMHLRANGRHAPPAEPTIPTERSNNSVPVVFTLPGIVARPAQMPIAPVRECQWIDGDPRAKPIRFCCKPVDRKSFCVEHFGRAYHRSRSEVSDAL